MASVGGVGAGEVDSMVVVIASPAASSLAFSSAGEKSSVMSPKLALKVGRPARARQRSRRPAAERLGWIRSTEALSETFEEVRPPRHELVEVFILFFFDHKYEKKNKGLLLQ